MVAYYNEFDPKAAEWLRQLIRAGAIAPGDVDERSIVDVPSVELKSYDQHHFFAGIGVWSYALRQAGWEDDRPIITGSAPCQPFSSAGKRKGSDDKRDLWWAMFWHLCQLRPEIVLGEQVASKDGLAWWDVVQSDLEGADYAATAFDLPAASVGAPHIRQRLFWLAVANTGSDWHRQRSSQSEGRQCEVGTAGGSKARHMADPSGEQRQQITRGLSGNEKTNGQSDGNHKLTGDGKNYVLADSESQRKTRFSPEDTGIAKPIHCCGVDDAFLHEHHEDRRGNRKTDCLPSIHRTTVCGREPGGTSNCSNESLGNASESGLSEPGCTRLSTVATQGRTGLEPQRERSGRASDSFWSDAIWLPCADEKFRPAKPGVFPLVNGIAPDLVCDSDSGLPDQEARGAFCRQESLSSRAGQIQTEATAEARAMRLKGYGNAIVAPLAVQFIEAVMELLEAS